MSNVNRERKLKPHQKWIWRKAFEANMVHMSIEAAEKKAWFAVDIWEKVGAFNESQSYPVDLPDHVIDWDAAWTALCGWLNFAVGDPGLNDSDIQALWQTLCLFQKGGVSIDAFKHQLQEIYVTD